MYSVEGRRPGSFCSPSIINPSGQAPPSGNVTSGGHTWSFIYAEDFNQSYGVGHWGTTLDGANNGAEAPFGSRYRGNISFQVDGTPDTWGQDPSGNGHSVYYPSKVLSTASSCLDFYVHSENISGTVRGLGSLVNLWWSGTSDFVGGTFDGQQYGRVSICWRTESVNGRKAVIAWAPQHGGDNQVSGGLDLLDGGLWSSYNAFLHLPEPPGSPQQEQWTPTPSNDPTAGAWRVTTAEWLSTGISLYYDGVQVFTDTTPAHLPTVKQTFTVQLETGPVSGPDPPSDESGHFQIDWIAFWNA